MADDPDTRPPTDAGGPTVDDTATGPSAGDAPSDAEPRTDDIDEYLDPELDPVGGSESDDSLPGPFSLSQLVRGFHFITAGIIAPFAWLAYQDGNLPQVASLCLLIALLIVAGVVTGRIAERRFG
jgi:hypothetical protein